MYKGQPLSLSAGQAYYFELEHYERKDRASIFNGWDTTNYARVKVSQDGGATWEPLPAEWVRPVINDTVTVTMSVAAGSRLAAASAQGVTVTDLSADLQSPQTLRFVGTAFALNRFFTSESVTLTGPATSVELTASAAAAGARPAVSTRPSIRC